MLAGPNQSQRFCYVNNTVLLTVSNEEEAKIVHLCYTQIRIFYYVDQEKPIYITLVYHQRTSLTSFTISYTQNITIYDLNRTEYICL